MLAPKLRPREPKHFNPRLGRNIPVQAHREGIVSLAKASYGAEVKTQRHSASVAVVGLNGAARIG